MYSWQTQRDCGRYTIAENIVYVGYDALAPSVIMIAIGKHKAVIRIVILR